MLLFDLFAVILGLYANEAILEVVLVVHLLFDVLLGDLHVRLTGHHLLSPLLLRPFFLHLLHDVLPLLCVRPQTMVEELIIVLALALGVKCIPSILA